MKQVLSLLLSLSLFITSTAFADCDFSKGITPGQNNTYVYTKECHEKVGATVQENTDLKKDVQLKDLALQTSDQRTQLWMDTTFKMEDKLQQVDTLQKRNDWTYFVLGALTIIGAGMVTASLTHRR